MRLAGCGFLPWYGSSTRRFAHRGGGFLVLLFVLRCSLCSCACAPLVCLLARAAATVASVIISSCFCLCFCLLSCLACCFLQFALSCSSFFLWFFLLFLAVLAVSILSEPLNLNKPTNPNSNQPKLLFCFCFSFCSSVQRPFSFFSLRKRESLLPAGSNLSDARC